MRIEILNTGTELLLGTTLNTHGKWFGEQLFKLGMRIQRLTTVPDGDAITIALRECVSRADAVIVTGGLGPTSDDLTREAAAEVVGADLIEDEAAMRSLEAFFAARNKVMAEANRKQAQVIVGADVLANANGTAPGIYVPPRLNKAANCAIFLLPGPPRELYPMFRDEVIPRLVALAGLAAAPGLLEMKLAGVGESDLQQEVDADLAQVPGLEVGYCARIGEVDLRLIGDKAAIAAGREIAMAKFAKEIFSDDGSSLEATVVRLLGERGLTLATAESCTGGLIANRVTDVPGSSAVFTHGFVTYANEAKRDLLGVPQLLLDEHGAVSEPVAKAMAEGALCVSGVDIAVAVTGIAGPDGGSEDKPVGTVWLAWAAKDRPTVAVRKLHPRNRKDFKLATSQSALDGIRRIALKMPV
ncbi:competence/damage-inducible protein A [Luteolibacter marinus]|uniref:competence/damage-inducible protein A n=1 Tax=Luteolibacter marinus TaxID=2776705 RepID=UPI0031B9C0A8